MRGYVLVSAVVLQILSLHGSDGRSYLLLRVSPIDAGRPSKVRYAVKYSVVKMVDLVPTDAVFASCLVSA